VAQVSREPNLRPIIAGSSVGCRPVSVNVLLPRHSSTARGRVSADRQGKRKVIRWLRPPSHCERGEAIYHPPDWDCFVARLLAM